mmetsp:Transcript_18016/g.51378  ORF Transcript_18016/g.51378 Transcript_18016/m.51378 type:complete len:277 (+) Transcript_18016:1127-1957(+)
MPGHVRRAHRAAGGVPPGAAGRLRGAAVDHDTLLLLWNRLRVTHRGLLVGVAHRSAAPGRRRVSPLFPEPGIEDVVGHDQGRLRKIRGDVGAAGGGDGRHRCARGAPAGRARRGAGRRVDRRGGCHRPERPPGADGGPPAPVRRRPGRPLRAGVQAERVLPARGRHLERRADWSGRVARAHQAARPGDREAVAELPGRRAVLHRPGPGVDHLPELRRDHRVRQAHSRGPTGLRRTCEESLPARVRRQGDGGLPERLAFHRARRRGDVVARRRDPRV